MQDKIKKRPEVDFGLNNFINMLSFLTMKQWEARGNNDTASISLEELTKIKEFISAFSDLTNNASLWCEQLKEEDYTYLAKEIEKARKFM